MFKMIYFRYYASICWCFGSLVMSPAYLLGSPTSQMATLYVINLKKFKIHLNKPKLKIVPIFGRSNGLFMNDNPK